MITVRLNGVVPSTLLTVSVAPEGDDAKLSSVVFGLSVMAVVVLRPPESVAVRSSSSDDG